MPFARALILRHRGLLAGLLVCTLALRLLVPSGYMPAVVHGAVTLEICSGVAPAPAMHHGGMKGMHHGEEGQGKHSKAEMPCAFAGLGMPALGSADPVLLAAALAFAFLLAIRGKAQTLPARPARLRPPLRAPPLSI